MQKVLRAMLVLTVSLAFVAKAAEGEGKATKYVVGSEPAKEVAAKKAGGDTLVIVARLVEIPGTFPPNDLYNYVYIMKYRVLKVVSGSYDVKEILVGQYNPLIPRTQITDKMDKYVDGDVEKFEEGAKHRLVLVTPVTKVWSEALEDDYFDSEMDKYFALKTDVAE